LFSLVVLPSSNRHENETNKRESAKIIVFNSILMMAEEKIDLIADISIAAAKYANHLAMVIEDKKYSYQQLFHIVCQVYTTICNREGDVVGIVAENRIETYASILATLFAGKTYVILHPDFPISRNTHIAKQAGICCLLCTDLTHEILEPALTIPKFCTSVSDFEQIPDTERGVPPVIKESAANAYIIFTSGSTGEPKGVPISRSNLNAFYRAYRKLGWHLDETDRMLQMFELTFDVSVVSFLYPLTLGASVFTVPSGGFKYLNVIDILDSYQLTFAAIAPSVLRLSRSYFQSIQLPKLKYMVVTAEATDVDLLTAFRPCIPNAAVVNLYGPTEGTIYCTSYTIPKTGIKHYNGMTAIGEPFSEMEMLIADEDGAPLPCNVKGELLISGPQLMRGYWHDPEKSALCLLRRSDGKVYYKTGDLCYRDEDGVLMYCGRKDTQVKIQGFRIELGEIEYQVKQFYENAFNAVVIPLYDDNHLCQMHLVIEKKEEDTQQLVQYLQNHLPAYMVPSKIHFLQSFPLNASNKVDRKTISKLIR
jgi:amino acid adenylation domain-containing protein